MGNGNVTGPKAPKDPTKKRSSVYLMLDDVIEGTKREDGNFAEICFLEGRVRAKVSNLMPQVPEEIATALQTCDGLRKYVHSIGVTATAQEAADRKEVLQFSLNCRRANDYQGTCYQMEVPCDGSERIVDLEGYPTAEGDTTLASFRMQFVKYMTAKMTIRFYLNDGYEVPELIPDPPVDFDSEAYREMIAKSCMQEGNLFRLQRAIEKARNGEDVTIAYIGGSITQGAGAKPIATNSYAYRSYEAFKNRFGKGDGSNVHFVKAGLGGTPSELGLCRYEREVLKSGEVKPDVLVIEFAVNDAGDETEGVCYESLALMAAKGPGAPAVVLLFAVFMDDFNLQERLSPVGKKYGFPMVSVKNAVTPQFYQEVPLMTKRQYFYDLFHPSNEGHRVMADCLDELWKRADAAPKAESDADYTLEPAIGNDYQALYVFTRDDMLKVGSEEGTKYCGEAELSKAVEIGKGYLAVTSLDAGSFTQTDKELQYAERDADSFGTAEYANNWKHTGGEGTESFKLSIQCKNLMIVYKDSGNQSFGTAEIMVDGKPARTINSLEVGWNHCNAYIIHTGDAVAEHKVEVKMQDNDKSFTILGFAYTLK